MRRPLFFLAFLVVLEVLAGFIYQPKERLEKILYILEQDSVLFWKHKSHLNVIFEDSVIKTNAEGFRADKEYSLKKTDGVKRIVCLGDSSTFGWGVSSENSYPQRLKEILTKNYPSSNCEVINAGMVGYSSYQGVIFLKNVIAKYFPDIITVAYMINDIDKYRFFRSDGKPDKELLSANQAIIFLKNMLQRLRLYNLTERAILDFFKGQDVLNAQDAITRPRERVSLQDYRSNLEKIIKIAGANNIKVIFLKMPVNMPVFTSFVPENSVYEAKKKISLALEDIKQGKFREAIIKLNESISQNPYSSEPYFYAGICYKRIKQYDLARDFFYKAKKTEAFYYNLECRKYNRIMEEVAAQYNVCLADITLAFKNNGAGRLFLEPIHPNGDGHRIIAQEVFRIISSGG